MMTPEQRLDRLERIAKLLVKAGLRARREMNEKINILIDAQLRNEERFARTDKKFAQLAEKSAEADEKFSQLAGKSAETDEKFAQLAESQANSGRRLDALIDIIRKEHEERGGNAGQP